VDKLLLSDGIALITLNNCLIPLFFENKPFILLEFIIIFMKKWISPFFNLLYCIFSIVLRDRYDKSCRPDRYPSVDNGQSAVIHIHGFCSPKSPFPVLDFALWITSRLREQANNQFV